MYKSTKLSSKQQFGGLREALPVRLSLDYEIYWFGVGLNFSNQHIPEST